MKEISEATNILGTNRIKELTDDSKWFGGWYQPIEFPDGTRTISTKDEKFFERDSLGIRKWEKVIKPNLPKGKSFLDIGCNAGLHMALSGFDKLWGIERHEHFFNQCLFALEQLGIEARIINEDVLDVELPKVDITLMANALYWVGYSDEGEFIDNYEQEIDNFLERLSKKTKWLVCVGAEGIDRIGGSLDKTIPVLEKHFKIEKSEKISLDRELNVIVCKSF
ncbi:MAG: hypothetical protein U9M90_01190 [Patescibacteria group bacterium]|nr:hypothetical protein [Patescibacteria group bacterium]